MSMELDHIFVMCDTGAPEAAALTRIGLIEGPGNVHPGQGTACRRFFFARQYLELLWVRDEAEARGEATAPTGLWERWSERRHDACPFGFVFKPTVAADVGCPVPTRLYRPRYLPDGLAIGIAAGTPVKEPEFFFLPVGPAHGHASGHAFLGEITHLCLGTPAGTPVSPAAGWAQSTGLLSVEPSDAYVLTVTFDQAVGDRAADLRPALPLVLQW